MLAAQPKLTCHICVVAKLISAAAVIKGLPAGPTCRAMATSIMGSRPAILNTSSATCTAHSTAQHSTARSSTRHTAQHVDAGNKVPLYTTHKEFEPYVLLQTSYTF
jgi:hypothetical protein